MSTNRINRLSQTDNPLPPDSRLLHVSRLVDPLHRTVGNRLEPGNRVRIKAGAFAGVEGTVVA